MYELSLQVINLEWLRWENTEEWLFLGCLLGESILLLIAIYL